MPQEPRRQSSLLLNRTNNASAPTQLARWLAEQHKQTNLMFWSRFSAHKGLNGKIPEWTERRSLSTPVYQPSGVGGRRTASPQLHLQKHPLRHNCKRWIERKLPISLSKPPRRTVIQDFHYTPWLYLRLELPDGSDWTWRICSPKNREELLRPRFGLMTCFIARKRLMLRNGVGIPESVPFGILLMQDNTLYLQHSVTPRMK